MRPGHDFIGVGVGAMVFDDEGRVFLAKRGAKARNEAGLWEFPGGMVDFGERLADAVVREFDEEYGMAVEVTGLIVVGVRTWLDYREEECELTTEAVRPGYRKPPELGNFWRWYETYIVLFIGASVAIMWLGAGFVLLPAMS